MTDLERDLLATAQRRSIWASTEARLRGLDPAVTRAAIKKLMKAKLIYRNSPPIRNFYGSSEAGYRAV